MSGRRRILGWTALLSAWMFACGAAAQVPLTRARLEHDLGGYERAPDEAAVRAWGGDAPALLMAVGDDPDAMPAVRQRAVFALRFFGDRAAVKDYLRAVAHAPGQGLFLLRAALDALVVGGDDVATAGAFLGDARAEVRDGAAWALLRSADPAARALLAARLRVERDDNVRRTIAGGLAASAPPRAAH